MAPGIYCQIGLPSAQHLREHPYAPIRFAAIAAAVLRPGSAHAMPTYIEQHSTSICFSSLPRGDLIKSGLTGEIQPWILRSRMVD